ncbi:MAG: flagellar FliJ family protein [Candidatus Poribacteria bacterium]|nr:flagellar FliJ family protein [Candidatus Poribacteria bacterium]
MLHELVRTLRRRDRMQRVRKLQEETAQQALAVTLKEEDDHKRERNAFDDAQSRAHSTMLDDIGNGVRSESLIPYVNRIDAMKAMVREKDVEIEAMQPRIQEGREEVILRYRARRAMEILTNKARENVLREELRDEQRNLDDQTSQRFAERHANRNEER